MRGAGSTNGENIRVKSVCRYFPGGPGVKTLCFQSRGHGFDPQSGN